MDPELLDFLLDSVEKCDSAGLDRLKERIKTREMTLSLEDVSPTQARIYGWLKADAKHFHVEKRAHNSPETKRYLLEVLVRCEATVKRHRLSRTAQRRLVRLMVGFVRDGWTHEKMPLNDTMLFRSMRSPDALVETMLPGYADAGNLNWALEGVEDDPAP